MVVALIALIAVVFPVVLHYSHFLFLSLVLPFPLKCIIMRGYCIIFGIYIINYCFLNFLYEVVVDGVRMWNVAHLSITEDTQTYVNIVLIIHWSRYRTGENLSCIFVGVDYSWSSIVHPTKHFFTLTNPIITL